MLAKGGGETGAGRNVIPNRHYQFLQALVLKSISNYIEALHQGYTCLHHRCELTSKHSDIKGCDFLAATKQRLWLLLYFIWNDALFTELGFNQSQAGTGKLTLGFVALPIFAFPNIRFQFLRFL